MFGIILTCISQLWELLCELVSSTSSHQAEASSASDPMPSTAPQMASSATPQMPSSKTSEMAFTTSESASTSSQTPLSSASPSPPTNWDVFLSFRGEDTRYNFTSHLYSALDRHGIRTFMDDPELRSGEVISDALLKAIQESKSYIVVLSENYASSSWCLDELVEILNCHKTMQRLVIPVFYNIEPAVVRHQTGRFEQDFKRHEFRFAGELGRVKNWRLTLRQVSDKSGKHIYEKRSEADVINEIVDEILLKLNPTNWDVFLSFRGEDTRYNFTSHLYSALDRCGVRTFMDDPKLRTQDVISEELIKVIQESKIYIVVLSKNYASSPWCLDELVHIFDCHKTMERLVIPVFYHIDQLHVQHQIGRLGEAFEKLQIYVDKARLGNWHSTLTDVAHLSGYQCSVLKNISEAGIITEIVDRILLQIDPKTLDVPEYLVGLDSRVEEVTTLFSSGAKLFSSGAKAVVMIGIHGMGGVGKTTLAKAVYNQNYRSFEGSCFLENVKEESGTEKGLVSLQKKLINGVLEYKNITVDNVDHGLELIRSRICLRKVLIVIDDLDDPKPLNFLSGPFPLGSVIIITTRNEDLLDSIEVTARYKVNVLGDAESHLLFAQHAFGNNQISKTLEELSKEIVKCAGGLPLALTVYGSKLLNQSDEEEWRCFSDVLKRVSIVEVEEKLLTSFDSLELVDPMLQDIFLDVSCFFIGWKKQEVVMIMETYYRFVNHYFDILKKRCFLTINDGDELEMHDLLRNMGRNIAHNNSPGEPGKHSRLWAFKDIYRVLKNLEGTEAIKGIIPHKLDFQMDALGEESFTTETFKRTSNLKFLYLKKVNITGSFEQAFEELRWFCWDCCPLKCLPSDFYPQELVTLELPHSNMRTIWGPNMVSHVFGKLKTLNMSHSQDLITTPDFTEFPCLETLNLGYCECLKEVHMSIGSLVWLVSIVLHGCVKLRSLPDTICNLRALKVLSISDCNSLEALPIQLGKIRSLRKLKADRLTVSMLPGSIGNLTMLVELDLSSNKNLVILPDTICNLTSLEILNIASCSSLEALPLAIGNLESLKTITGGKLTVSKLPDSIGSLTKLVTLDLRDNKELETLPDSICNLRSLEILRINGCEKLETLPDQLWKITNLRTLDAGFAYMLKKLPDIELGQIALSLQELDLSHSGIIALPSGFSQLSNLQSLDLRYCKKLQALPDELWKITRLRELNASGVKLLKKFPGIESGQIALSLQELDLSFSGIIALPSGFSQLSNLQSLDLRYCKKLRALPDELWKITRLRELNASGVKLLKKLPDIGSGQIALSLQELKLLSSGIIALPSGFSRLSNLQSLHLNRCHDLLYIPKLPPNLKWIDASYCESLKRLPNLSNLKQLEELNLSFCSGLTYIQGLEDLISIRRLDLSRCHDLERLPNLSNLKQLEELNLSFCSGLTNIQGLEDLISIRRLVLRGLTHRYLPKRLFKVYSEFGHQINVQVSEFMDQKTDPLPQWLDWIIESPYWTSKSSEYPESTAVYADLLPNESHNFMGIILCFQRPWYLSDFGCSVKNTTSGFIWSSGSFYVPSSCSLMVMVPKAIFSVTDDDHRIELTTNDNVEIVGIHLLYNTETETIEDVVEKHVIHIDALKLIDPVLPDIFLDIACFFIGWQKKRVVQILETYYTNVDHHIDILKTRCLLKINDQDELEMDDLFQYLGRNLVHNNSLEESEKLSRLWLLTDIYDALKKHKGTEVIEGIVPHEGYPWDRDDALTGESFTLETFEKMSKLRFLYLRKVHLTGSFEQTFQDLRWFCWKHCPLKCLPFEFYPPKLVFLELPHSNIITMWELNMVPHVFQKLKTLNMSDSQGLTTTPDFTKLPCLETLNLRGCKSLEEVHISIGSLVRLVSIDLHGCIKLRSLPNTICNLRTLEELDISGCSCLEALPMPLGNIQSLREFNAGNLTVSVLPDSIGHLSKLVNLRLNSNKNLKTLPNLSNLKQLEILDLTNCIGLTKILGLEVLTSLRELHLGGCDSSHLAYIFTESLFQMYSQFGHPIQICSTEFPDWISQSSEYESTTVLKESIESNEYCPMSLNLPPNVSHNYLGMILCIRSSAFFTSYSVEKTTSDFIWTGEFRSFGDKSLMVIVPRSTFSVEDGDDRIVLKADRYAKLYGIHLLYKTEEYDSTTVMKC